MAVEKKTKNIAVAYKWTTATNMTTTPPLIHNTPLPRSLDTSSQPLPDSHKTPLPHSLEKMSTDDSIESELEAQIEAELE